MKEYIGKIESHGFYIGDVCYVLDSKSYYEVWGEKYDYQDGKIPTDNNSFLVHGTAYGDGEYFDQYGHSYGVDAGVIGVVPEELISKEKLEEYKKYNHTIDTLGRYVEGKTAEMYYQDGEFEIIIDGKVFTIPTGFEEEYEEDEEEEW